MIFRNRSASKLNWMSCSTIEIGRISHLNCQHKYVYLNSVLFSLNCGCFCHTYRLQEEFGILLRLRATATSHTLSHAESLCHSFHCRCVLDNQEKGGLSLHFLYKVWPRTVEAAVNGECFRNWISKRNMRLYKYNIIIVVKESQRESEKGERIIKRRWNGKRVRLLRHPPPKKLERKLEDMGDRWRKEGHDSMKKVQQSKDDENLVKLTDLCRYNWLQK